MQLGGVIVSLEFLRGDNEASQMGQEVEKQKLIEQNQKLKQRLAELQQEVGEGDRKKHKEDFQTRKAVFFLLFSAAV